MAADLKAPQEGLPPPASTPCQEHLLEAGWALLCSTGLDALPHMSINGGTGSILFHHPTQLAPSPPTQEEARGTSLPAGAPLDLLLHCSPPPPPENRQALQKGTPWAELARVHEHLSVCIVPMHELLPLHPHVPADSLTAPQCPPLQCPFLSPSTIKKAAGAASLCVLHWLPPQATEGLVGGGWAGAVRHVPLKATFSA